MFQSFPLEKYYVSWCGECEEERVQMFGDLRPIRKTWHLENKLNSTPGSHLECLVELEQVPNSNADDRNDNIIFTSVQMVLNMAVRRIQLYKIVKKPKKYNSTQNQMQNKTATKQKYQEYFYQRKSRLLSLSHTHTKTHVHTHKHKHAHRHTHKGLKFCNEMSKICHIN